MGKKDNKDDRNKSNQDDIKRDQKLQAIILADSFEKNFRPISFEKPKVLLPLVNIPMLEYTVEFLAQNGVEEIFIFCVWHAELLQEYIQNSSWSPTISVKCITSSNCTSAGDALRELDSLGVIRSDPFVLISGDVISNLDLKKAIAYHQEKRKADGDTIMTVALKKVQHNEVGLKSLFDDLVVAIDNSTGQMLLFDDQFERHRVNFPRELMQDHASISFRTDLLDCHVDICSPELMLQLSDNFDYQDIRRDFIKNEVINRDLGKHIYGYIIDKEYAARVHDPRTYHSISRDILTRWVYPIVPDSRLVNNNEYVQLGQYYYRERDCNISRSVRIGECVAIGKSCKIGNSSYLQKSVIGDNCFVGDNVSVTESHIWEGCRIENGVKIDSTIIAAGVIIRKNAVLMPGCIISQNVVIAEGVTVPSNTRISTLPQDEDSEPNGTLVEGVGYVWIPEMDSEEPVEDDLSTKLLVKGHSIASTELEQWKTKRWSIVGAPDEESDSDDDNDPPTTQLGHLNFSVTNNFKSSASNQDFDSFIKEMIGSGHEERNPPENVLLEIKGFKFAQNKTFSDCIRACTGPLLTICLQNCSLEKQVLTILTSQFKEGGWSYTILISLLQEDEDELCLLLSVEEFFLSSDNPLVVPKLFRYILQILNSSGLLSEDTILEWVASRKKDDKNSARYAMFMNNHVQEFVEWLETEESEDEDEEEDDD